MEHGINFWNAEEAVATTTLDLDTRKEEYAQVHNSEREKEQREPRRKHACCLQVPNSSKSAYKKAKQAVEAAKLTAMMEGVKAFELYGNLLSNEARQPWDMIVQAQTTKCPWEDIYGVTHDETPTKTWDAFLVCITIHLQQMSRHDLNITL